MTEAAHNARVERDLIAVITEVFGDGAAPTQDTLDLTAKRLRQLLKGNKQLNPAERIGIEGRVWRHFRNGSRERAFLNEIGFLGWN
jgi:hypothetical protein